MHTYIEREINFGLIKVGSNSPDAGSPVALALNASIELLCAQLNARIAALETQLAAAQ